MRSEVVYEDKNVLVIYKPAGLATQTARVGQPDVVSELQNYCHRKMGQAKELSRSRLPSPYIGVVHRLDQPVEGLLVFAKDKTSAARLSAQLGEGDLNKRYYAVVFGKPAAGEGELQDELVKEEGSQLTRVVSSQQARVVSSQQARVASSQLTRVVSREEAAGNQSARKAVLHYRLLESLDSTDMAVLGNQPAALPYAIEGDCSLSLLDVRIETGRFHQIRAQLAHAGLPLLGDSKYGNPESCEASQRLKVRNVALCAYGLSFRHPVTGKRMDFTRMPEGAVFALFKSIKKA